MSTLDVKMADGQEGQRRPKRRCAAAKTAMPSAIHYVGYVEDDETPEAIMRKFEELEKVLLAPSALQGFRTFP